MSAPRRPRIVLPVDDPPLAAGSPHLERLARVGEVTLHADLPRSVEEQLARTRDAEVLLLTRTSVRWPRAVLEQIPGLRLVSLAAIGTDCVDLDAARDLGVTVCNIGGGTAPVVAEHEFALMLAAAKHLAYQTAEVKAGRWNVGEHLTLRGKTLGVIGTGNTGAAMAQLARAIGMDVIAWTFHPTEERARALGVRFVALDQLLATADVVSLHVALTSETRHLLGAPEFARMKRGAVVVNGSRGAVVDTDALVDALRSGHLGAAGLDVFDPEPLPPDHPLLALDQVVLTPHNADATPEGVDTLNRVAVDNVIAFLEGRPEHVVS